MDKNDLRGNDMMKKVENKKEAIMESAIELFTTRGFDNTSTASISKNAGVATGTLFTYFDNKVDLINELYLKTKKELFDVLMSTDLEQFITEDLLRRVWKNMIGWGMENPSKMKFIMQYSSSPYITKLTMEGIEEEMVMMSDIFGRSIEKGIIKDLPSDFLIDATTSHIYSTILYMIAEDVDDDDLLDELFPTLWDMIRRTENDRSEKEA